MMEQLSNMGCAVTLRCRSEAKASKGDGDSWLSSFEARKGSHLRMTLQSFSFKPITL